MNYPKEKKKSLTVHNLNYIYKVLFAMKCAYS